MLYRETFYDRHMALNTSCSEVKYICNKVRRENEEFKEIMFCALSRYIIDPQRVHEVYTTSQ